MHSSCSSWFAVRIQEKTSVRCGCRGTSDILKKLSPYKTCVVIHMIFRILRNDTLLYLVLRGWWSGSGPYARLFLVQKD